MRTFIYYVFLLVLLASCRVDNVADVQKSSFEKSDSMNGKIAYPISRTYLTRSSSMASGWEKWDKIQLASGEYVHTPWNKELTSGTIPYEIRSDIQPSDGWDLIAHTVNGYGEKGI